MALWAHCIFRAKSAARTGRVAPWIRKPTASTSIRIRVLIRCEPFQPASRCLALKPPGVFLNPPPNPEKKRMARLGEGVPAEAAELDPEAREDSAAAADRLDTLRVASTI